MNPTKLFLMFMILGAVGRFSHGSPLFVEPKEECLAKWRKQKNTLFENNGREKYEDFYKRLDRGNCWKEWLVVIYMAADNDLSPYAYRDLWEMEAEGSAISVDYVVFHDGLKEDGLRYYHMSKRPKAQDYRPLLEQYVKANGIEELEPIEKEKSFWADKGASLIQSPQVKFIEEVGEQGNSGKVSTAVEFVEWALTQYPSRRVMMIGWSHGEGFDSTAEVKAKGLKGAFSNFNSSNEKRKERGRQGGFAYDFTSKSHMAVTDIGSALFRTATDLRGKNTFDILGSDACLNQQVEFGYEALGVSDYVFGSSSLVQSKGFNYKTLFQEVNRAPKRETRALARAIPKIYGESVRGNNIYSSYKDPYATMATWNMGELKSVHFALDELAAVLIEWANSPSDVFDKIQRQEALKKAFLDSVRFSFVSYDLTNAMQSLDAWAREEQTNAESEDAKEEFQAIRDKASSVKSRVIASVLANYIGEAYRDHLVQTSQGVAIWVPSSKAEFDEMYPKFKKGRFYQSIDSPGVLSAWAKFVGFLWKEL